MEDAKTRKSDEELVQVALEKYQHGEVGMRGAADTAGLSLAAMIAELNERGVLKNYDAADLESDVENLL